LELEGEGLRRGQASRWEQQVKVWRRKRVEIEDQMLLEEIDR
jgi:hypothetical protein